MTDHEHDPSVGAVRQPVPEDGIGDRIREARELRSWTQKVLATRTKIVDPNSEGISRTVLVGYESGKTKPGAREIRMLADALGVTPSWLVLGSRIPASSLLPSLEFLQGRNALEKAIRIGLAIQLLKPHEQDAIATLLFSLGGRELGDRRLSGLMSIGRLLANEVLERVGRDYPEISPSDISSDQLRLLAERLSETCSTNWGNRLQYGEDGEVVGGEWTYPEHSRSE